MEIKNNNDKLNFQGSFLIKYQKHIPELKEGLEEVIGKNHKQIFENFNNKKNQVMYVLKDSKDARVTKYLEKNNLSFKYYPSMNTKCRFDETEPEGVIEYIRKNKPTAYSTIDETITAIANRGIKIRKKQTPTNAPDIENILASLKFDRKEGEINSIKNEIVRFIDNLTQEKIFISPRTKLGTRFVYKVPNKEYEAIKRYAFDENGNILKTFDGPNGIKTFNEQFKKATETVKQ